MSSFSIRNSRLDCFVAHFRAYQIHITFGLGSGDTAEDGYRDQDPCHGSPAFGEERQVEGQQESKAWIIYTALSLQVSA